FFLTDFFVGATFEARCCFCSIQYEEAHPTQLEPPREANYGHPVPPWSRDGVGDPSVIARPAQLFRGAGETAGARRERTHPARGAGVALCLSAAGEPRSCQAVGAETPARDVLR